MAVSLLNACIVALTGDLEQNTEDTPPENENVQNMLKLDPSRIKSLTFPNYIDPDVKDDMVCQTYCTCVVKNTRPLL